GIGPGLGRDELGKKWFDAVVRLSLPKVMDADALFFLAQTPVYDDHRIMTPHPAEAARLLGASIEYVEADRFKAVRSLQERYGGVVVLKGAGTLIYDGQHMSVCMAGNPGMATGGMGDVLTGVITSLVAQGLELANAAQVGVWIHSSAADSNAALHGERGLLASDLLPHLRQLVN
ncbi:MAG: NAD(P)H-hydrate dehydratase, partial [Vibrio sp.]